MKTHDAREGIASFADSVKAGAQEPAASGSAAPAAPQAAPAPGPRPSGATAPAAPSSGSAAAAPAFQIRPPSGGTVERAGGTATAEAPMAEHKDQSGSDDDDEHSVSDELKSMLGSDPSPRQGPVRQPGPDTRARMAAEFESGYAGPALTPAGLSREAMTGAGRTPAGGTPRLVPDTDGALPPEEVAFRRLLRILQREVRIILDKFTQEELPKLVKSAVENALNEKKR